MAKVLLVIGFVIAFGAGWMMNSGFERRHRQEQAQAPAATSPTTRPRRGGFLTTELNLTADQQEKMKLIWDGTRRNGREDWDRRNLFRKDRDEAIAALIRPEDKDKYEQIQKTYGERNAAMDKEIRSAWEGAVEKTKAILAAEQLKKYEEFLKNHEPPKGPREHDQGRRVEDRATSRPGSEK